jgi:Flp pilus assembly protein TadB
MQVSEQIEVIKGQMQYYEEASATSEISVQISAKASVQPVSVAGWEPKGVARNAVQALINFGKGFVNFLIWLGIYILPIVIVIGAPIFFFVRWLVRRKRRADEKLRQMPPLPSEKK